MASKTEELLELINTVYEAIKAAGPTGIPDGHLYAMLMGIFGSRWTIGFHNQVVSLLVDAGKITNKNHNLVAK